MTAVLVVLATVDVALIVHGIRFDRRYFGYFPSEGVFFLIWFLACVVGGFYRWFWLEN